VSANSHLWLSVDLSREDCFCKGGLPQGWFEEVLQSDLSTEYGVSLKTDVVIQKMKNDWVGVFNPRRFHHFHHELLSSFLSFNKILQSKN
jgi:hypothetical protein